MQPRDQPRTLIFGSSYISSEAGRDETALWARTNKYLNPDIDTLLIDSCSPYNPRNYDDIFRNCKTIIRMEENLGHPMRMRDGWGRDLCYGINYAIEKSYDWVVFIESDLIFARPVMPTITKLCRIGCFAAAPMNFEYKWIETGLMFLSVPYLSQSKFIERYDWAAHEPPFLCEPHVEKLLEEELLALPFRGIRNDFDKVTRANFAEAYPYGCDYLTHCKDFELYKILLRNHRVEV
jgi:hypothetical protein